MNTAFRHHPHSSRTATALIVGGGIIGGAIAYALGKAGFACTVLEKGAWAQEASSAAAGMLGAQVEIHEDGPFYALCRESLRMYRTWTDELEAATGLHTQYMTEGIMRAALTEEDERELRSRLSWMRDASWLSAEDMRRLEPELSPHVRGGLHLPADHQIHPVWLVRALRAALVAQGCAIREWTPAFRLTADPASGRVTGVETAAGLLYADVTVVAAGAWSTALTAPLGLSLPIFPVKGQCISVRPEQPLIRSTLFTKGCYIVPKRDGSYLIGATQVEAGFDKRATAQGIGDLAARAAALLPAVADAEFVGTWAGLRPGTRDGLPFLGGWEQAPGLLLATGHYRNGILLAPVTGALIAQTAQEQTPLLDLKPFAPSRSAAPTAATV